MFKNSISMGKFRGKNIIKSEVFMFNFPFLMNELATGIGIIIGVIVVLVLLNKFLDYLYSRFFVGYNIFLLAGAVGIFFLMKNWMSSGSSDPTSAYLGIHVVYFYIYFTNIQPSNWTETVGRVRETWSGDIEISVHDEDHYRPAWWNKIITIVVATVVVWIVGIGLELTWLVLILECLIPGYLLFYYYTNRAS